MHDTERFESSLVKGNRSIEIFDGYEDVVEQEFTPVSEYFSPILSECHIIYETYIEKLIYP